MSRPRRISAASGRALAAVLAWCCVASVAPAAPAEAAPPRGGEGETPGRVTLGRGIAAIDLPEGWRYRPSAGARRAIREGRGRAPTRGELGLLLPPARWGGIVVSYRDRGYVTDDDAGRIDPHGLLRSLLRDVVAGNPARSRAGEPPVEILGWARPPHYDPAAHRLSWGIVLKVEGAPRRVLNYDVRVLGADGFLALQAVANARDLDGVIADVEQVTTRIELARGRRYADHDPLWHRRAGHGLRELVSVTPRSAVSDGRLLVKPAVVVLVVAAAAVLRHRLRASA